MKYEVTLALKRIWRRRWVACLCIVLFSLSMGLLSTVISLKSLTENAERQVKKCLVDSVYQYGLISIDYYEKKEEIQKDYGSVREFFNQIRKLPAVKSLGSNSSSGTNRLLQEESAWKRILERQREHPLPYSMDDWMGDSDSKVYCVLCMDMNCGLWDAYDFSLSDGFIPYETEDVLIYFGSYFHDSVSVGDVFFSESNTYRVAGFLEDGESILDDGFLFWNNAIDTNSLSLVLKSTISLDNLVLCVYPENDYVNQFQMISWDKRYKIDEVEEQIRTITEPYDIPVDLSSLKEKISVDLAFNNAFVKPLREIGLVIGVVAILLILCTQLLSILQKKNELGILLSQGFSRFAIYRVLFLENVFQIGIASVFSPLIIRSQLYQTGMSDQLKVTFWKTIVIPAFIFVLLFLVLLSVFSSFIILRLVSQTSSASLLKGELKHHRYIYSGLFLCSFALTLSMLYYNLYLSNSISEVKKSQRYTDEYYNFSISIDSPSPSLEEIYNWKNTVESEIPGGFALINAELPIARRTYGNSVSIILDRSRCINYLLSEGDYPNMSEQGTVPSCVIGEGNLSSTYEMDGKRFLMIAHIPFEVTGVLESYHISGFDYRIITYADTVSKDILSELISDYPVYLQYWKESIFTQSQEDKYMTMLQQQFGERLSFYEVVSESSKGGTSESIATIYEIVCACLIMISLVNLVLIAFLWGVKQELNNMILWVNGFSRKMIFLRNMRSILKYEGVALIIVLSFVVFLGFIHDNVSQMIQSMLNGLVPGLALLIAFGVIVSLASSIRMIFEKPAVVLKHTE